jgi:type IV secretion system protein VirB4
MIIELLIKFFAKEKKKVTAKKINSDFIPYVCNYSPDTILTKNGELLQTIRITGFGSASSISSQIISLREAIREAILDNAKDEKFAFWFHTIRRKKKVSLEGEFNDFFSNSLNQFWIEENNLQNQYVNEFYITIIIEGLDTSISNFDSFVRSFSYIATNSLHKNYLENAHKKLQAVSNKILQDVKKYGAKLLGIREWDGILYSEHLRFFGKIVNLYEERYPLVANDISLELATHKIAVGSNELEVVGYNNKNFAAMLSIKEYHEITDDSLDTILQLPFEFIISQSFDFTHSKKEMESYEYQDYLLKVSGDEDFRSGSGIKDFIESGKNPKTDYGKLQTTLMLISDNKETLEKEVVLATEKIHHLGFIIVREDVFLAHCFFSQLPGNFKLLKRQKPINTRLIAGFAALNNFIAGEIAGNHWGPAATTLTTILDTQYFFNFHNKDLGHTLVVGPELSGKTTLVNFLLTQSRRFNNKIFYFTSDKSSKCFAESLSGRHFTITDDTKNSEYLEMNPFLLETTEQNLTFLVSFIKELTMFIKGDVPQSEINSIYGNISKALESRSSSVCDISNYFEDAENIKAKLNVWSGGKLSNIFSARDHDLSDEINIFNLEEIIEQKPIIIPVVSYLMHKIKLKLDGKPSIIIFDAIEEILDNFVFEETMKGFMQEMREKNCIILFVAKDPNLLAKTNIINDIKRGIACEIFLPFSEIDETAKSTFDLSDDEVEIIKILSNDERNIFIKHDENSIISRFDLSNLKEILSILSSDEKTIAIMGEVISHDSNEGIKPSPSIWIPEMIDVLEEA